MALLELVEGHQRAMQRLSERAERSVARLWSQYGTLDASSVEFAQFLGAARQEILAGRITAAQAAEIYYAAVRELAGITAPFEWVDRSLLLPSENAYLTQRLTEAGPNAALRRAARGLAPAEAIAASQSGVVGLAGQYVQYASRGSIMQTAARDPYTVEGRYFRVAHPGCCAICAIAASRGAVYRSDKRKYHTFCRCEVCPAFPGLTGPVGVGARAARMYEELGSSKFADFEAAWEAGGRGG